MTEANDAAAIEALNIITSALSRLDKETRRRVLDSVATFFGAHFSAAPDQGSAPLHVQSEGLRGLGFSTDHAPSPKEFMMEKQPRTDVERIACLAYYLTHYRETPHFKTLDLGKLNTEAAQPKFSNTAYASQNALTMGYLAAASKGQRQLSAAGEQFVRALPDREAAKQAMAAALPRRKSGKRKSRGPASS